MIDLLACRIYAAAVGIKGHRKDRSFNYQNIIYNRTGILVVSVVIVIGA